MKKILLVLAILLITSMAFAQTFEVNLNGKVVDNLGNSLEGKNVRLLSYVDGSTGFEDVDEMQTLSNGEFNFVFDWDTSKDFYSMGISGECVNLFYDIVYDGEYFTVTERNKSLEIYEEKGTDIDLGQLYDDRSGKLQVNSDVEVRTELYNSNGNSIGGGNTNLSYQHNSSAVFVPGENYKIELISESGNKWTKTFTASDEYCKTTLIKKNAENLSVEYCDDCPKSTGGKNTIRLYEGWNLVPNIQSLPGAPNTSEDGCASNITYRFLYSNLTNSYFGFNHKENKYFPSLSKVQELTSNEYGFYGSPSAEIPYYGMPSFGGIWIYSNAYCSFLADLGSKNMKTIVEDHKVKKGWNFISIHPWMIGKNLPDIFKNCTVSAVNTWDNFEQHWYFPSSSSETAKTFAEDKSTLYEAALGTVLVVKVADDCYLNTGNNPEGPPALPN